ncbi:MAG: hypothetical protein HYY06_00290 [Deltaproteobacteria bacterium]|nr:hypothetical protein [Deltaproteobacteria bacterium]
MLVAHGGAAVTLLDRWNPEAPVLAATLPTRDFAREVATDGRFACVADGEAGLTVLGLERAAPR